MNVYSEQYNNLIAEKNAQKTETLHTRISSSP